MNYLIEMRWLAENGVSQDFESYLALPIGVLDDCRMVMQYEARKRIREGRR